MCVCVCDRVCVPCVQCFVCVSVFWSGCLIKEAESPKSRLDEAGVCAGSFPVASSFLLQLACTLRLCALQIEAVLSQPERAVQRTRARTGAFSVIGQSAAASVAAPTEPYDLDLFDDSDFYQQVGCQVLCLIAA